MAEPKDVTNSNETKIKSIIVEQLQVDEKQLVREAKLIDDLGADSLDIVELCMQFEEAFDLTIPDADVCKWRTVGNVIDYLLDRIQRSSRKTSALSSHRNEPGAGAGAGASSTQPGTRVDESIALESTSESNPYVITGRMHETP